MRFALSPRLLLFPPGLERVLRQDRLAHLGDELAVTLVEIHDLQAGGVTSLAAGRCRRHGDQDPEGHDDGDHLRKEQSVLAQELGHRRASMETLAGYGNC